MVPLVFDDIIAAEPFRVRRKLGGDQLVELVLREGARLSQALPADRLRSVDQHHCVELRRIGRFEQQGNVADDDPISPLSRFGQKLPSAAVHLGMHDGVERFQGPRVRQNEGPEPGTVQSPVGTDHLPAEPGGDLQQGRAPRHLGLTDELVGVYDGGTPATEQFRDGRLASADVSCQSNGKHGGRSRVKAPESRVED